MSTTKINKPGFYCACDHVYFNTLAQVTALSCQQHAPWASFHFHIFDATPEDQAWCVKHNISVTTEQTPVEYSQSQEDKRGYWVNARFIRLPELYLDTVKVMSVDADSVFVRELTQAQFEQDLAHSWVTTAKKREQQSLGSAVGFGSDSARHVLAEKLVNTPRLTWYLDQIVMDQMIEQGTLDTMDTRYSDFKMTDASFVWTGKGDRKYKQKFKTQAEKYHEKIFT